VNENSPFDSDEDYKKVRRSVDNFFQREALSGLERYMDLGRMYPYDGLISCKLSLVEEYGVKIRPITISSASQVYLGHCWRSRLYPLLRLKDITRLPIEQLDYDMPMDIEIPFISGKRDTYIITSSDFSSATDQIPHHLIEVFIDTLEKE